MTFVPSVQAIEPYEKGAYVKNSELLMAQVVIEQMVAGIHEGTRCLSVTDKEGRKESIKEQVQKFKGKYADLSVPLFEKGFTNTVLFVLPVMGEEMYGVGLFMREFCDARDKHNGTQYLYLKYKNYLQNALKEIASGDIARFHKIHAVMKGAKEKGLIGLPFVLALLMHIDEELAKQPHD